MNSGNIVAVVVGNRPIMWDVDGTGPKLRWQQIYVAQGGATTTPPPTPLPGGPGPWPPIPPIVIGPDANGWVTMDPSATNQGFSGPLIRFASGSVVPAGAAPGDGAGNPVTAPKNGTMLRIRFEAEPVGGPTVAWPTLFNELEHVYINNWSDVNLLDLTEFHGAGHNSCSALASDLDIQYTTDHELMRSWGMGISSAAIPPVVVPALPGGPTVAEPRGEAGTKHIGISGWLACSYLVSLTTQRKLTDGEDDDSGHTNLLTFCKD
jgi:hypothetical protein